MPGTAIAACPVAADLKDGIRVDFEDGSYSIFDQFQGQIRERILDTSEDPSENFVAVLTTHKGVFQTSYFDMTSVSDRFHESYTYSFSYDEVLPLVPGKHFGGTMTSVSTDDTYETPYSFAIGDEDLIEIGECRYRVFPFTEFLKYPEGITTVTLAYLTELGISVLLEDKGQGYDAATYTPTQIRSLPISE